jgi:Putative zinc-finger
LLTHEQIEARHMIEEYVRGTLPAADRESFEDHYFACDECFARVQNLERFLAGVRNAGRRGALAAAPEQGWWRPAFAVAAAACFCLAAGLAWALLITIPSRNAEVAGLKAAVTATRQQAERDTGASEANVPVAVLTAVRGDAGNRLVVPKSARQVLLWIDVPAGNAMYRLRIRSGGHTIATMDELMRNAQGALAASFPARLLPAGDYIAELTSGGRIIEVYPLNIQRR